CVCAGYLLATIDARPRRALAATSTSRCDLRSSRPVLLPACHTCERKYSSPYLWKISLLLSAVPIVWTALVWIIAEELLSSDRNRMTPGAATLSTTYWPAENTVGPIWKPNGIFTTIFCDP